MLTWSQTQAVNCQYVPLGLWNSFTHFQFWSLIITREKNSPFFTAKFSLNTVISIFCNFYFLPLWSLRILFFDSQYQAFIFVPVIKTPPFPTQTSMASLVKTDSRIKLEGNLGTNILVSMVTLSPLQIPRVSSHCENGGKCTAPRQLPCLEAGLTRRLRNMVQKLNKTKFN